MKIAIVTYSLRVGGVESVIFNLGKSFISKGIQVEVIETLEEGIWKSYFTDHGIKVVSIVKKPLKKGISHSKQIASYLNKFDIVLLNDAPLAQSGIGTLRSDILIFPIMHMALVSMANNATGNMGQWNKIIAVSPLLKNFLQENEPAIREGDIVCIPNGIDTTKFVPNSKNHIQQKKILFLGRLSEEKGVMLLTGIINKIKDHVNFDLLDIYGSGPLEDDLKRIIDGSNLQLKINLKGVIDHETVCEVLPKYDILIMPSFQEGHPIVLLEAMACGVVPVVSLLTGSTDIVVEHGVNGYLSEIGNMDLFSFHLTQAMENKSLPDMAQRARERIISNFGIDKMRDEYLELFKQFRDSSTSRSGHIDKTLLGDLPYLPYVLVRPTRKILRTLGLWKKN